MDCRKTKTARNFLMKIPRFSKLKATKRRFSNYAPESWNSPPLDVRNIDNIVSFKGKLKNYLLGYLLVAKSFLCNFFEYPFFVFWF